MNLTSPIKVVGKKNQISPINNGSMKPRDSVNTIYSHITPERLISESDEKASNQKVQVVKMVLDQKYTKISQKNELKLLKPVLNPSMKRLYEKEALAYQQMSS